jgi:hypothetical protein
MSIQQIEVHLHMAHSYTSDYKRKEWRPQIWYVRVSDEESRIYVGPRLIAVEVPDDFDPTARIVAVLEAEKAAALQQYQSTVADINERLSKFLAITNETQT